MRYLIDTNIFLFYVADLFSLDSTIRRILEDYENIIYISSESIKEAIHLFQTRKLGSKKWKSANDIIDFVDQELGFVINYVKKEHLLTMSLLELVDEHNDPSDRLIIAQAITEKMPLISSDRKFENYRRQKLEFIYNEK